MVTGDMIFDTPIPTLMGWKLVESPYCTTTVQVQYKFPKTKSNRVRKKWANRPKNFKSEVQRNCYFLKDTNTILIPEGYTQAILEAKPKT